MNENRSRICPVSLSGTLDNRFRRLFQDPVKILSPYVKDGMTALDLGCGPGFFTIAMAGLVGESGRVIAADLQDGMLRRLGKKISGTEFENRIMLHKCEEEGLNLKKRLDFALAFYMVHEVPDKARLFREIFDLLKPGAGFLVVEPKFFHVSGEEFKNTVNHAMSAGFETTPGPRLPFSWSVILEKAVSFQQ